MKTLIFLLILLVIPLGICEDAKLEFKPSFNFSIGSSFTPMKEDKVYALAQVHLAYLHGEDGGLRILGIGTTIEKDSQILISPITACFKDVLCIGPNIGKDFLGFSLGMSLGKK